MQKASSSQPNAARQTQSDAEAQRPGKTSRRTRLARLIGRLLARVWVQDRRSAGRKP